jgi:UDP-N-acetylglucosamine enolpyruvyl transferase
MLATVPAHLTMTRLTDTALDLRRKLPVQRSILKHSVTGKLRRAKSLKKMADERRSSIASSAALFAAAKVKALAASGGDMIGSLSVDSTLQELRIMQMHSSKDEEEAAAAIAAAERSLEQVVDEDEMEHEVTHSQAEEAVAALLVRLSKALSKAKDRLKHNPDMVSNRYHIKLCTTIERYFCTL